MIGPAVAEIAILGENNKTLTLSNFFSVGPRAKNFVREKLLEMSYRTVCNNPHVDIFARTLRISNFHFSAKNLHFTQ